MPDFSTENRRVILSLHSRIVIQASVAAALVSLGKPFFCDHENISLMGATNIFVQSKFLIKIKPFIGYLCHLWKVDFAFLKVNLKVAS